MTSPKDKFIAYHLCFKCGCHRCSIAAANRGILTWCGMIDSGLPNIYHKFRSILMRLFNDPNILIKDRNI